MPCFSPLYGYKSKHVSANGKRTITFSSKSGFSDLQMTVPCGQCIGCRIDRSRQWALRCVHESKLHTANSFVTLTYDENNVPPGHSLVKRDLQLFFKNLRYSHGQFRYFAAGEYGDQTKRPHYHVLLFGIDFRDDRKKHSQNKRGDALYTSESLTKTWGLGQSYIGEFNYASAAYTARYIMKKQLGKNSSESEAYTRYDSVTGELYQVEPEFCLMSRRPGLGSGWYDKYKKDAFPSDYLVHEGKKHPVPRFYYDKLKKSDPGQFDEISNKRKLARLLDKPNSTPDRLYTREVCKKAKLSLLKRTI